MITSFTARYLAKGAEFLTGELEPLKSSVPHQLGRGLYSLGVIVAAPCGILYHSMQGIRFRIQPAFTSNAQEIKPLKERSVKHLDAALYDLKGFATTMMSVIVTVVVFATVFLAFNRDWILVLYATFAVAFFWRDLAEDLLVFTFAKRPSEYLEFISDRVTDLAVPSDRTRSEIESWIKPMVAAGMVIDQPLTDAQVSELFDDMQSVGPIAQWLSKPDNGSFRLSATVP